MQFAPIPLEEAEGKILAHNLSGPDGIRVLSKGRVLAAEDIVALRQCGLLTVDAAWLDPDDMDENTAAQTIASAISGACIEVSRPAVGRVNLRAEAHGVLRIDAARLDAINQYDGIAVATLAAHSVVEPRKIVATIKIIPFGLPKQILQSTAEIASAGAAVIGVDALSARHVGLILCGSPALRERLFNDFRALEDRVVALDSQVTETAFINLADPLVESALAEALAQLVRQRVGLILIAGETAIMHRNDTIPRGVERAGGTIECVGAPVEPGNLLMLAYLGNIPVLGAPGCARSPKANVVDQVIPRLLVGERLARADIIKLAHGGLLSG